MKTEEEFIILDIRKYWEIEKASLNDDSVIVLPMSQIVYKGLDAFPENVNNKEK